VVSGGQDGTVQVWRARDGSQVFTLRGHTGAVRDVLWSGDDVLGTDGIVVSAGDDRTIRRWGLSNGKLLSTYRGDQQEIRALAQTYIQNQLVLVSASTDVEIWEPASGSALVSSQTQASPILAVAVVPTQGLVVWGKADGTIEVWKIEF
jgi:WD40 repeat protein